MGAWGLTPGRGLAAGLVVLVYVAGSAWLIRGEGQAYREVLRARRQTLAVEPAPVDRIEPVPSKVEPTASTAPDPPRVTKPSLADARNPAPTLPPPVRTPPKDPSTLPPLPPLDPFWELPDQKKVWDLDHLSIEQERELGRALHAMVLHSHKPLEVGPLPKRVEDAAQSFLKAVRRPGIDYTFTVLDCDESNAFSHPGGYIYLCRGIFDWIAEEEDYALAFLVGHEIAHVELGHALSCLRDPEVKKLKSGTVPLFASLLIPWGYNESKQDLEADRWVWQVMSRDGKSRREILAFLRKLEDHARKNGFENRRKKPGDDPRLAPIDNHLRAHPIPRLRLKALQELMDPASKPG